MTNEKRKAAIGTLNQEIQKHFNALQQLLQLESSVNLQNGSYIPQVAASYIDLDKVRADEADLMISISDLSLVCCALHRGKNKVNIHGATEEDGHILTKTLQSLKIAGLLLDWDGSTTILLP